MNESLVQLIFRPGHTQPSGVSQPSIRISPPETVTPTIGTRDPPLRVAQAWLLAWIRVTGRHRMTTWSRAAFMGHRKSLHIPSSFATSTDLHREISTVRSPSLPPDITRVSTGQFPPTGLSPAGMAASVAARSPRSLENPSAASDFRGETAQATDNIVEREG